MLITVVVTSGEQTRGGKRILTVAGLFDFFHNENIFIYHLYSKNIILDTATVY